MRLIHQKSRCDRGIQGFHLTFHWNFEVLPGLVGDLFGQSVSFIADEECGGLPEGKAILIFLSLQVRRVAMDPALMHLRQHRG